MNGEPLKNLTEMVRASGAGFGKLEARDKDGNVTHLWLYAEGETAADLSVAIDKMDEQWNGELPTPSGTACDGNHAMPECLDAQCWHRDPPPDAVGELHEAEDHGWRP